MSRHDVIIIVGFYGALLAPQTVYAHEYDRMLCTPAMPFANSGHAVVLTGYYKNADGEGIFTMNDPGGKGAHCFYRNENGKRVVEQWFGEAPEAEVKKWITHAYYIHPASVQ